MREKNVNTWNSHFSNFLTDLPSFPFQNLKSPKNRIYKRQISHNFAVFFSSTSLSLLQKSLKTIHTQHKSLTAIQIWSFHGCLNGKIWFSLTLSPFKLPGKTRDLSHTRTRLNVMFFRVAHEQSQDVSYSTHELNLPPEFLFSLYM